MKNKIRGRVLTGILTAALLCTAIPETAYAVEMPEEAAQEQTMEEDMLPEDGETSENEMAPGDGEDTQGEEESVDGDASNEDMPSDDTDEAGEQETEAPSDEDIEETEEEEELQTDVSEEEAFPDAEEIIEESGEIALYAAGGFVPRTTNPGNNSYYTSGNPYSGPNNCTYYAWGRAHELLGYRPHTWTGNAGNWWYNNDGYERGSTPRLGAIMCWGVSSNNAYGHVAVVEAIGNGTISFSEASYSPAYSFAYKENISINTLSNIYRGTFLGYIYLPGIPGAISQEHGGYWDEGLYPVIPDGDYHIVSALGDRWWLTNGGFSMNEHGNVQLWEYDDLECDHHVYNFKFIPDGKGKGRGFYVITNKLSGLCLDSVGASAWLYDQSTGGRTNVQQHCHCSSGQEWAINEIDGGDKGMLYTFYARCSGYVMDVEDALAASGTNISMWKDNGSAAQQWRLIPWAPTVGRTIGDGEYQIVPYSADDKVVSVAGGSPKDGTNVELNSRKGDYKHTFDVKYEGKGYYSIINKESGLSLDVEGGSGSRKLGANIQLWTRDGNSSAQKWIIKSCGGGYYQVISKSNGLYLDLQGGRTEDGANIGLWKGIDTNLNLKWKFIPYKNPKLDPPTADIPSGTEVVTGTGISLSCSMEGASIYYTLDGTDPSGQSTLYTVPIAVTENVTVKAIAVKEGYLDSDVVVFAYTVKSDDPDDPEEPDQPGENVPKEDMPDDGVIPDGLWIAGLAESRYYYTGKSIKPTVRVYDHKTLLKEKTDYTISYKNNTNAYGYGASDFAFDAKKAPTITVTGRGNYTGRETQTFKILPQGIGSPSFAADDMAVAYKNGVQKPVPTLFWQDKKLKNNTDFTVVYYSDGNRVDSVKEAGRYDIEINGKGNFGGTRRIGLTVTKDLKLMSKMTVERIKNQTYTGYAITPALTVKDGRTKLTEGEHYTVSYSRNTAAGTAYAVVTGIEEAGYSGTKRIGFKITGTPISKAVVTGLTGKAFIYGGVNFEPELSLCIKEKRDGVTEEISLTPGVDYTLTWQKNRDAGTATVIFTGKGAYTGTIKKAFKINAFDIAVNEEGRFEAKLQQSTVSYAKSGAKPKVTVTFRQSNGATQTLKEGKDYTLSYKNNNAVNEGGDSQKIPTVTVKGKGNFKGTFSTNLTYQIAARNIGELTLTAADRMYQNKKNAFVTKVTVTDLDGRVLSAGKDYEKTFTYVYKDETTVKNGTTSDSGTTVRAAGTTVEPNDIIPVGTILTVTVTAKEGGNYTGMIAGDYRITQASISSASVSIPKQTYTGKPIELDKNQITVRIKGKSVDSSQYEIVPGSYKNNVKKGTASVTIRGVDNYGGTKTVKFTIKAKGFIWWK